MSSVVFVAGLAGTGKSTLADLLAENLGGVHLDFDRVSAQVVADARVRHPELSEAEVLARVKDERYAALRAALQDVCSREPDTPVVVSAPFTRQIASPETWQVWESAAPGSLLVWLRLDEADRQRRVTARGATRDVGVAAVPVGRPAVPHLALDAAAPPTELAAAIQRALAGD